MTDVTRIRVSDAERESVVVQLQHATAEGRLSLDELGDRTSEAYAAVTRLDLDQLIDDLPAAVPEPDEDFDEEPVGEGASGALSFTILGMGVASIPLAFSSALGPALGVITIVLAVLTLSLRRETSSLNRAAILVGVGAGVLTPVFFLTLLLLIGG